MPGIRNRVFIRRSRVRSRGPKKAAVKLQPTARNCDCMFCPFPPHIGQLRPEYPAKKAANGQETAFIKRVIAWLERQKGVSHFSPCEGGYEGREAGESFFYLLLLPLFQMQSQGKA